MTPAIVAASASDTLLTSLPKNRREASLTPKIANEPRWPSGTLDPAEVAGWTETDYRRELRGSAMKRAKLPMLKRNANHLSLATGHLQRTKGK